ACAISPRGAASTRAAPLLSRTAPSPSPPCVPLTRRTVFPAIWRGETEVGMEQPLLDVQQLTKYYPLQGGVLHRLLPQRQTPVLRAVDGVSFTMAPGETLGLVGESGCGKTTTGRLILRAIEPTSGSIVFAGQDITALHGPALQPFRRQVQIVFQDP